MMGQANLGNLAQIIHTLYLKIQVTGKNSVPKLSEVVAELDQLILLTSQHI